MIWPRAHDYCENGFDHIGAAGTNYVDNHEDYSMTAHRQKVMNSGYLVISLIVIPLRWIGKQYVST